MSDLFQPTGIALKSARLLGVELAFINDSRGRVWIPLTPQSHLIYGRNGAGKSTVLRALLAVLTGMISEKELGFHMRLFVEISDKPTGTVTLQFFDDLDSDGEPNVRTEEDRTDRSNIVEEISKSEWWSDPYTPSVTDTESFLETMRWLSQGETELDESQFASHWTPDLSVSLHQSRIAWLAYHLQSNDLWDEEDSSREGWNDARELIREAATQEVYCLRPRGHGRWMLSCAVSTESATATRVVSLIKQDFKAKYVEFHKQRMGWTDEQINSGATHDDFETESFESEFLGKLGPLAALIGWDAPPSTQWAESQVVSPYLEIQDWRSNPTIEWRWLFGEYFSSQKQDVAIVDLNEPVDLEAWNRKHVSEALTPHGSASWQVSFSHEVLESQTVMARAVGDELEPEREVTFVDKAENKAVFNSPLLQEYQMLLDQIASDAAQFGIGIDGVRCHLNEDIHQWIHGTACSLEVRSQVTGAWFPSTGLSPSQRTILTVLLKVRDARERGHAVICLGDEIDSGLHVSAIRNLYRYLEDESDVSYLSSHSPVVLSLAEHRRLLVSNSQDRPIDIREWKPDGDFKAAADVLGVDKQHLLSAVTCWVIVEGEHDVAAFAALLNDPTDYTSLIKILPARGHMNTQNVLNCEAILNYSDAPIVIVLDGVSEIDFIDVKGKIQELKRSGVPGRAVIDRVIRPLTSGKLMPETQTLLSILTSAVNSEKFERLFLIGLKERDIIQYLPPNVLGLNGTWESLFSEFRLSKADTSFKDWLRRQHGIKISTPLVAKWFEQLDQIQPELAEAVTLISSLSRGDHIR